MCFRNGVAKENLSLWYCLVLSVQRWRTKDASLSDTRVGYALAFLREAKAVRASKAFLLGLLLCFYSWLSPCEQEGLQEGGSCTLFPVQAVLSNERGCLGLLQREEGSGLGITQEDARALANDMPQMEPLSSIWSQERLVQCADTHCLMWGSLMKESVFDRDGEQ